MDDMLMWKGWCVDEQVPILAHTDETNGTKEEYKELAAAHHWACALSKYPDLRVNFGHLGGLDDADPDGVFRASLPATSQAFVAMLGARGSPNAYGDVAFSSNMILDQAGYDQLAKQITIEGVNVRTILGRGDAAGEIVRIALQEKADIIVIATHGMTGWRRVVFGSVAEKVVRLATTPVLATRGTELQTLSNA